MRTDGKMQLQTGADVKVTITFVNTFIVYMKVLYYMWSYLMGTFLIAHMEVRYSPLHYLLLLIYIPYLQIVTVFEINMSFTMYIITIVVYLKRCLHKTLHPILTCIISVAIHF